MPGSGPAPGVPSRAGQDGSDAVARAIRESAAAAARILTDQVAGGTGAGVSVALPGEMGPACLPPLASQVARMLHTLACTEDPRHGA